MVFRLTGDDTQIYLTKDRLPHCGELVTTINAVGVFVGALIGVSELKTKL